MTTIRVKGKKALYMKKSCSIRERVRHTLAFLYICAFTRNLSPAGPPILYNSMIPTVVAIPITSILYVSIVVRVASNEQKKRGTIFTSLPSLTYKQRLNTF
jgi:hypothetical protein